MQKIKEWFKLLRKKKTVIVISILLLIFLLSFFGTKIGLYYHFLIGNDLLIKLATDNEDIRLGHGQQQNITFKAEVTTNPFCEAECKSTFEDLSYKRIIDQDDFALKIIKPVKKIYTLTEQKIGSGQQLYRFTMECKSKKTRFCNTKDEPTKRSILITVEYDLTEEEKQQSDKIKQELENITSALIEIKNLDLSIQYKITQIENKIIIDDIETYIEQLNISINSIVQKTYNYQKLWNTQEYGLILQDIEKTNQDLIQINQELIEKNKELDIIIVKYDNMTGEIKEIKNIIDFLKNQYLTDELDSLDTNKLIDKFNIAIKQLTEKNSIEENQKIIKEITEETKLISDQIKEKNKKYSIKNKIKIAIEYDSICQVANICIQNEDISDILNTTENYLDSCRQIDEIEETYKLIINQTEQYDNYPNTTEFSNNITQKIKNIKQNIINDYLDNIRTKKELTILNQYIAKKEIKETAEYTEFNLTTALIKEMIKQQPEQCAKLNITINDTIKLELEEINMTGYKQSEEILQITFSKPLPECCTLGKCSDCCSTDECKNNPENYPILFLHGHAFNKDISAEYSLDAFNKIQEKLEEEGYINAGGISVYTPKNKPEGIWGLMNAPISIKASYYLDIYKEQQDYILIQTKSENIDTYAVRLKELIDIIKYNTGKPKVKIIAHSMGGLVARRYMEIFGTENVDRVILIATPNNGITGDTASYCPIIGEQLECRDMTQGSLFINKLNQEKIPDIPITMIVGIGCNMKDSDGDGIVLQENAILEGAKNYYINGTCKGIELLHTELLNIDKYPETYNMIIETLKKQ